MSLFSKQRVHCMACGRWFMTDFFVYGGTVCDAKCHEELQWRKTLSIMGRTYYPNPKEPWKSPTPPAPE